MRKAYSSGNFAHVPMMVGATSADIGGKSGFMIAGARDAAAAIADKGVPTWEYRFSYVADSVGQPGAQHASDIPFFLDTQAVKYGDKTTPRDNQVGDTISRYLVNFAKTGDPNGGSLPGWPRYTRDGDQIMDFSAEGKAVAGRDPWGKEIEAGKARLSQATASGRYTTMTTPLGTLLDTPAAKAVLERQVPDVLANPRIGMARGMTLQALQSYVPTLTTEKLRAIDAALAGVAVPAASAADE